MDVGIPTFDLTETGTKILSNKMIRIFSSYPDVLKIQIGDEEVFVYKDKLEKAISIF